MILSPTFWEKSPTFLGKISHVFWKMSNVFWKRPMFLLDAWRRMILTSEKHFWCSQSSSFPPLSRVRVRAHPTFLHFLLSQPSQKMGVVYWNTTPCESIRNGVLQKCMKVRLVEAMKGVVFGGEIVWFASHFYENSTPIGWRLWKQKVYVCW